MKIIFLIPNNYADVLTPFLNSIQLFLLQNFQISIISFTKREKIEECFNGNNIEIIELHEINLNFTDKISSIFIKKYINSILFTLHKIKFLIRLIFYRVNTKSFFFATDPFSLISVYFKSKFNKTINFAYFEQELNYSKDIKSFFFRLVKKLEIIANQKAQFSIEFDELRAKILCQDNCLSEKNVIVIANSSIGDPITHKEYFFHEKFKIPENKKILLFTGGLASYNFNIELIKLSYLLPENVITVLHLFTIEEKLKNLIEINNRMNKDFNINKVYFNTELLPFNKRDIVYQSSDYGFCLYGTETVNLKYVGFSSGRLFNFLKAGKPVILGNSELYRKFLFKFPCGIIVSKIEEIITKFDELIYNEKIFKENAHLAHDFFRFDKHFYKISDRIK